MFECVRPAIGQVEELDQCVVRFVPRRVAAQPFPGHGECLRDVVGLPKLGQPRSPRLAMQAREAKPHSVRPLLELGSVAKVPALQEVSLVQGQHLLAAARLEASLEFESIDRDALRYTETLALRHDPVLSQLLSQQVEGLVEGVTGPVRRKSAPDGSLRDVPGDLTLHRQEDEQRDPGGPLDEARQLLPGPGDPDASESLDADFHGGTCGDNRRFFTRPQDLKSRGPSMPALTPLSYSSQPFQRNQASIPTATSTMLPSAIG